MGGKMVLTWVSSALLLLPGFALAEPTGNHLLPPGQISQKRMEPTGNFVTPDLIGDKGGKGAIMASAVSKTPVRKIARISGKPGRTAELREALKTLEQATRAESGCVEFIFFQAISEEPSFILLEHFTDEDALKTHMQQPHTQAFFKAQPIQSVHAVEVPSLGGE